MVRLAVGLMFAAILVLPHNAAAQGIDVRLVIDISGSMKTGDPEYLRQDVLNGLVDMLPPGSRSAVWTFGSKPNRVVAPGVIDEDWRRAARAARSNIGSIALRTNLGDALAAAAWDVADVSNTWERHILLVSDGRIDLTDDASANALQRRMIASDLLPRLRAANIRLDCLALSDKADLNFLKELATATNGRAGYADTVAGVKRYLHEVLGEYANAAANDAAQGSLTVAAGTDEATVFAEHRDGGFVLFTPSNERIDASNTSESIRWFDGDGVSLVSITAPAAGTWRFAPASAAPRVWSQFGIDIRPDDSVGAPSLRVTLTDAGAPIDEPQLSSLVTVEAELKTLYGTEELSVVPSEAVPNTYAVALGSMPLTADDEVTMRVVGKTFERTRGYVERVAHPIDVEVRDAEQGNAAALVRVAIADMDQTSLRVLGSTRSAGDRIKLVVGSKQTDGAWLVAIPGSDSGVDVGLKVLYKTLINKEIEVPLDVIHLALPVSKTLYRGFDAQGHAVLDPVRPAPSVSGNDAPSDIAPDLAAAQLEQQANAIAPAAPDETPGPGRALAFWEWIAMAVISLASVGLLVWTLLRSRRATPGGPLDTALDAYRAAIAAASTKPPVIATT